MDSRRMILEKIRRHQPPATNLPDPSDLGMAYDDPKAQFESMLSAVGGHVTFIESRSDVRRAIEQLDAYRSAKTVVSQVPELSRCDIGLESLKRPHDLDGLDLAILPGEFCVAENAAIWVTDQGLPHRILYFICEHLILVVSQDAWVHNMHQAYQRLRVSDTSYGVFISGPSKTADIEQSLVIGAQGPRSLHVVLQVPPRQSNSLRGIA